eukprot:scaffold114651_cov57-Phaeocystis_antarctica.AAC.1
MCSERYGRPPSVARRASAAVTKSRPQVAERSPPSVPHLGVGVRARVGLGIGLVGLGLGLASGCAALAPHPPAGWHWPPSVPSAADAPPGTATRAAGWPRLCLPPG